ncbi:MAG: hypothetical protein V4719_11935, partial [Planctomycetota bacterium]
MIRSICVWLVQFCVRHVTSWPWPRLLSGLGCGFILLELQQQYLAQLGSSQPVTAAAWTVVSLALALAWGLNRNVFDNDRADASLSRTLTIPAVLIGLSLLTPWCWGVHDMLLSESLLVSRWGLFFYSACWAVVSLGTAVWCVGRLSLQGDVGLAPSNASSPRPTAAFLLGVSGGLAIGLAVTWGSLFVTAIIGCVILCGAQVWRLLAARKLSAPVAAVAHVAPIANAPNSWVAGSSMLLVVACGGLGLWTVQILGLL